MKISNSLLAEGKAGYTYLFGIRERETCFGVTIAETICDAFKLMEFSGICTYFALDEYISGWPHGRIALSLEFKNKKYIAGKKWYADFGQELITLVNAGDSMTWEEGFVDIISKKEMRKTLLCRGIVEFINGIPVTIIDHCGEEYQTWFLETAALRMADSSDEDEGDIDEFERDEDEYADEDYVIDEDEDNGEADNEEITEDIF